MKMLFYCSILFFRVIFFTVFAFRNTEHSNKKTKKNERRNDTVNRFFTQVVSNWTVEAQQHVLLPSLNTFKLWKYTLAYSFYIGTKIFYCIFNVTWFSLPLLLLMLWCEECILAWPRTICFFFFSPIHDLSVSIA